MACWPCRRFAVGSGRGRVGGRGALGSGRSRLGGDGTGMTARSHRAEAQRAGSAIARAAASAAAASRPDWSASPAENAAAAAAPGSSPRRVASVTRAAKASARVLGSVIPPASAAARAGRPSAAQVAGRLCSASVHRRREARRAEGDHRPIALPVRARRAGNSGEQVATTSTLR